MITNPGSKTILCFIILFIAASSVSGQERKLLKRVKGAEYEEFEVRSDNKKVRDGIYLKYKGSIQLGVIVLERGHYRNGAKDGVWEHFYSVRPYNVLEEKGTMINGFREGLWEEFYHIEPTSDSYIEMRTDELTVYLPESGVLFSRGMYENDKKVGIWEFLYPGNYTYQKYNYNTRQPVPLNEADKNVTSHERPEYVGGKSRLEHELTNTSFKTGIIKSNGSNSGSLVVEVTINESGLADNFIIKSKTETTKHFEKKALELLQEIPNEWIPKATNGMSEKAVIEIGISVIYEKVLSNFSTSKIQFILD